jgi:hypothetical protein
MPGGTREGAGRKATPIDLNELEKLCMMGCNEGEIAAWFKVSVRTIQTRRKQPKFAEAMRRGLAKSCINVRRLQFRLLEAGNATMAVWLGKNLLGQRDNMQITGAHGGPIQTENKPDFSLLNEDELRALRAMLAKINREVAK